MILLSTFFYSARKVFHCILHAALVFSTAVLVYPLLLVVFVPARLYRKLVATFVQNWDSKYGDILTGLDALLAGQDPYNKSIITLSPYFSFNDRVERSHIVKILNEQVIKPNLFPNLKQKIVRKFGYYFWYSVDNFNVEDHVKYLNPKCPDEPVSMATLRRLASERNGKLPFDPSKSPWELILVPNIVYPNNPAEKSAFYLRVNHCLMDGYSAVSFLHKLAINPWTNYAANNAPKNTQSGGKANAIINKLPLLLKMFVTGPYHFLHGAVNTIDGNSFLKKALTPSASKHDLGWAFKLTESRQIDGAKFKRLCKALNVNVSSLLITMVSEAIIRFIKRRCEDGYCEKLPKAIVNNMSFPLSGHPEKMTNHWTPVRMVIPVNKDSDPRKTLQNVHEQYQHFKTSIVPLVNFIALQLLGVLPIFMQPDMVKLAVQTITLTNFPGPSGNPDIFGYELVGFALSGGFPVGSVFLAASLGLHGKFWIDLGGMTSAIPSVEHLNELGYHVQDVFFELESTVISKLCIADAEYDADVMNGNSF